MKKFNINHCSDLRRPGHEYNMQPSVKYDGGSAIVLDCVSATDVGNLTKGHEIRKSLIHNAIHL